MASDIEISGTLNNKSGATDVVVIAQVFYQSASDSVFCKELSMADGEFKMAPKREKGVILADMDASGNFALSIKRSFGMCDYEIASINLGAVKMAWYQRYQNDKKLIFSLPKVVESDESTDEVSCTLSGICNPEQIGMARGDQLSINLIITE